MSKKEKTKSETVATKTIVYDYMFNYFGGDKFKEKIITGASILLAVHVYKDGEEIKFQEEKEPGENNLYLCDVFQVSYDRELFYTIKRNTLNDTLFRLTFGWDEIQYEVAGYELTYESAWTEEELKDMPEIMKNLPISAVMEVTEEEFKEFLSRHADDFDIRDNINAQVPSVSYM